MFVLYCIILTLFLLGTTGFFKRKLWLSVTMFFMIGILGILSPHILSTLLWNNMVQLELVQVRQLEWLFFFCCKIGGIGLIVNAVFYFRSARGQR